MRKLITLIILMSLALSGCGSNTVRERCLADKYITFHPSDTDQTKREVIAHNLELEEYCK